MCHQTIEVHLVHAKTCIRDALLQTLNGPEALAWGEVNDRLDVVAMDELPDKGAGARVVKHHMQVLPFRSTLCDRGQCAHTLWLAFEWPSDCLSPLPEDLTLRLEIHDPNPFSRKVIQNNRSQRVAVAAASMLDPFLHRQIETRLADVEDPLQGVQREVATAERIPEEKRGVAAHTLAGKPYSIKQHLTPRRPRLQETVTPGATITRNKPN